MQLEKNFKKAGETLNDIGVSLTKSKTELNNLGLNSNVYLSFSTLINKEYVQAEEKIQEVLVNFKISFSTLRNSTRNPENTTTEKEKSQTDFQNKICDLENECIEILHQFNTNVDAILKNAETNKNLQQNS